MRKPPQMNFHFTWRINFPNRLPVILLIGWGRRHASTPGVVWCEETGGPSKVVGRPYRVHIVPGIWPSYKIIVTVPTDPNLSSLVQIFRFPGYARFDTGHWAGRALAAWMNLPAPAHGICASCLRGTAVRVPERRDCSSCTNLPVHSAASETALIWSFVRTSYSTGKTSDRWRFSAIFFVFISTEYSSSEYLD